MEGPEYEPIGDSPPYARRRHSPTRTAHRDTTAQNADPDTCRICRGESTPEEPLFYPCKCSGSIKYVHQDCLMEWLSHSQKKHCELCKTPFRFTKLYSPRMPSTLPTHVFAAHMVRYILDNLVVWLRAFLVGCVWLFWVPYLMRRVWSLLFWLSDEGLGSLFLAKDIGATVGNATLSDTSPANDTSVLAKLSALAENQSAADLLNYNASSSLNETFSGNASAAARLPYLILGAIFPSLMPRNGTSMSAEELSAEIATQRTLLSNVKWLQNLTRQPAVNRFVIMVLEGQVITVLVIICFILVILVRDYVVQQQPEINMRAAFAAQDAARLEREVAAGPQQAAGPPQDPNLVLLDSDDDDDQEWDSTDDDDDEPERDARTLIGEGEEESVHDHPDYPHHPPVFTRPAGPIHDPSEGQGSSQNAPGEEPTGAQGTQRPPSPPPLVGVNRAERYLRMFQEAEGDPEAMLRIIRDDNYTALANTERGATAQAEQEASMNGDSGGTTDNDGGLGQMDSGSENTFRDSNALPTPTGSEDERRSKGKSREELFEELPEQGETTGFEFTNHGDTDRAPYSRRRAVSDGPQPREFPNPLANNSWSFSPISTGALPPAEQAESTAGPSFVPPTTNSADLTPVDEAPESSHAPSVHGAIPADGEPSSATNGIGPAGPENQTRDHEQANPPAAAQQTNGAGPHNGDPAAQQPEPERTLWAQVADYLWGNIDEHDEDHEDDEDVEEIPRAHDHHDHHDHEGDAEDLGDEGEEDEEGAEAFDQDALDDIEDFEGIMELIGMRGPLMGLFQNAVFCACLVFVAVFLGIFLPYNLGRTSISVVANPMRVVRMLFSLSKLIQDVVAVVVGGISLSTLSALSLAKRVFGMQETNDTITTGITYTWEITANASARLSSGFVKELPVRASEIQNFSAISHHALLSLKGHISMASTAMWSLIQFLVDTPVSQIAVTAAKGAFGATVMAKDLVFSAASAIIHPGAWVVDLDRAAPPVPINPDLASWSGGDRFWAILGGYISFALLAGLYVNRWAPFSGSQVGQEWEASIVDVINQASGVTKVILIIGIEMLAFPLYCGLLMDAALLPLFEEATIRSRYEFTMNYPLTSMFVHWFVGTGYMFHFALFVSMCRKIMRKGVLYFIRDPDDPEFHPVRDVLERNFFTQLRKIMFSALVYGGLVIVCLGGVVWGLRISFSSVLPIHYSSNEPVLEFPVDLLFYNFLMPLAVRILRPSDALHAMYTWWFKRCARMLRLTWFLFGRRQVDEEGTLVLGANSPHRELPWYKRMILKIDENEHVAPKSLREIITEMMPSTLATRIPKDAVLAKLKRKLVRRGQLRPDGRFVRSPASDQVRIPKGRRVFLDVYETTQAPVAPVVDLDLYYSEQYQLAYLPPHFRLRIFYFIFLIWVFAAVTGVGLTVVPLVVGRRLFKTLLPGHVRTNDIYAFSIGFYVLGALAYSVLRARAISSKLRAWARRAGTALLGPGGPARATALVGRAVQLAFAYFNVFVFFPLLASTIVELYVIIPLHTYLHPPRMAGLAQGAPGVHTIRAVQAWTLGLLYLKLASRVVRTWEGSRLASASRAVFRRGYLRPDVPLLARAFVLPAVVLAFVAVLAPPLLFVPVIRGVLRVTGWRSWEGAEDEVARALVYRVSFLLTAVAGLGGMLGWSLLGAFRGWKARVRDEAYLVGERLHNFGVVARRATERRRREAAGG